MNKYPLTTNHFSVQWGGTRIAFTEVSGLSISTEPIHFREGSSPDSDPKKMPGKLKYSNVILKRTIMDSDNEFYTWMNTVAFNTIERRNITISLLNEVQEPVISWRLDNAFPVKIEWSDLKANANEPAVETIEITHEGLVIEHN
ncbi:phage tail protein [Bizionia myxarmorum]|uniref:Phage tail protein n=1 Tax=Bizionia myxarmorum TaxID=291186 RepID=A0A5D0R3J5_9FLAO|nr:phage tail protein [Bizionia myxarmorum]TYB76160.1 phage tail protein [Bizionia myxarmorum]